MMLQGMLNKASLRWPHATQSGSLTVHCFPTSPRRRTSGRMLHRVSRLSLRLSLGPPVPMTLASLVRHTRSLDVVYTIIDATCSDCADHGRRPALHDQRRTRHRICHIPQPCCYRGSNVHCSFRASYTTQHRKRWWTYYCIPYARTTRNRAATT